jgi:hypothetical protein
LETALQLTKVAVKLMVSASAWDIVKFVLTPECLSMDAIIWNLF